MNIAVRGATQADYPQIREILTRAFRTDDECRLFDHLVAHDPAVRPDLIRVAIADGRPVACTMLVPRQIRTPRGWVPGAIVTLVACHPDYQGKGYGGATVRDAVRVMAAEGMAVGQLFGHPEYYPRFGFVAVIPHLDTMLPVPGNTPAGVLRPAVPEDIPAMQVLYESQVAVYPLNTNRCPEPWTWFSRNPDRFTVLILPDRRGYAFVDAQPDSEHLYVCEAGAADEAAAGTLTVGLLAEAARCGKRVVRTQMPGDHPVTRELLRQGATQKRRPPGPGMAIINDWSAVLPAGYTVTDDGLLHDGRLVFPAGQRELTELALGLKSVDVLRRDFPESHPKWSLEPFWE